MIQNKFDLVSLLLSPTSHSKFRHHSNKFQRYSQELYCNLKSTLSFQTTSTVVRFFNQCDVF